MKRTFLFLVLSALSMQLQAQDNHYTLISYNPQAINPALTGQLDGRLRAAAGYRNNYSSPIIPFSSYYFSADAPVKQVDNYGYFAAGAMINGGNAGAGSLQNFAADLSLAYHIAPLTEIDDKMVAENDLSMGVQGGYRQASIDLSRVYFGSTNTTSFIPGGSPGLYQLGIGNQYSRYIVNTGFTFTHRNRRYTYTAGLGIDNLTQPRDDASRQLSSTLGMDKRISVMASANILLDEYFSVRPNAYFLSAPAFNVFFGGADLCLRVPVKDTSVTLSIGAWYRSGNVGSVTVGVQYSRYSFSIAYDNAFGNVTTSTGRGAVEFALHFILPPLPDPTAYKKKK
ncbi:MAG: PorP/SprF family type IX secretion system membrane protein [Taibaiella sp.]|nr:PorP/SprF family type IX secretion system membrane protein [Taibaiella sp.]